MQDEQDKPTIVAGPGAALQKARTDKGLTQEEVAKKLHLSPHQIAALEADDYEHLPGPTYVRGYLRSYVEILGLAHESVLKAYADVSASTKAPSLNGIAPKEQMTSQHYQVKSTTYLVIGILVALALAWWQGREPNVVSKPLASVQVQPAEVMPGLTTPSEVTGAFETAAVNSPGPTITGLEAQPPSLNNPTLDPGPRPAPASGLTNVSNDPAVTNRIIRSSQSSLTDKIPASQRAHLVLYTDQESWMDIRDGHDVKLLYETIPPGRSVTLEGVLPISVFLGNAKGVRIEFNGQAYDIARHTRGQVARFILGKPRAAE